MKKNIALKKKPKSGRIRAKPRKTNALPKKRSPISWKKVESTLRNLLEKVIRSFAKAHPQEIFYALFVDFAEDWTHIRVHLNTTELLRQRAAEYMRSNPELYARRSLESVAAEIRWEPGDFGYFEINNTRTWKKTWGPIAEKLAKAAAKQNPTVYAAGDFIELQFLVTLTRVLLQLEAEGNFEPLRRTRGFRICCMRPEERADDAWRRMSALRRQMRTAAVNV